MQNETRQTDFPTEGDDLKISLRNSQYDRFDLDFAQNIKEFNPEIWELGGNIRGNEAFDLGVRARDGSEAPEVLDWIREREAWAARHLEDGSQFSDGDLEPNRSNVGGIVAQMKWHVVGSLGEQRMKDVILELIKKLEGKKEDDRAIADLSDNERQALENKVEEHNEEYGDTASKRVTLGMLTEVYERGLGAYETNPASVRPGVASASQWGYARVNSFLFAVRNERFQGGQHDTDLFPEGHPLRSDEERSNESRPYPNEHAARINNPEKYMDFYREADAGGAGIDFIYGVYVEELERVSEIQSVRFDSDRYTMEQALNWLRENEMEPIKFEEAIEERDQDAMEHRHIVSITETEDSFLIEFGKGEMFEGVNLMPEQLEESENEMDEMGNEMTEERVSKVDTQFRAEHLDYRMIDDRRVSMTISSETPVERSYGREVINHSAESLDLEFLNSGNAPLLLDHDSSIRSQVGVIESVSLDSSARRLRATVRFGRSELAEQILADVADGIYKNVSIGYRVREMKRDESEADLFRITDAEILEVSLVALPADTSVGIGRSSDQSSQENHSPILETVMSEKTQDQIAAEARASRDKEVAEIFGLAAKFNKRSFADDCVRNGMSIEEFRGKLLDEVGDQPLAFPEVEMNAKEEREYSLMNYINARANGKPTPGLVQEISDDLAKRYGKDPRGVYVPSNIMFKRNVLTTSPAFGSNLVPEDHLAGEFIDALRANLVLGSLGVRMMQGLEGDVAIPALNAKTAVSFVAEDAAPGAEGAPTFRQVTMSPKEMRQHVDISRKLARQSDPSVEQIIRDDMTRQFASKIDEVAINGGGTSEPDGILQTNGIGSVALGSNGGAINYASIVDLEREVAIDNALTGSLAYLTNPKVVGEMRQTPRQTSGVEGNFILNDTNMLLGYNVASTTNVPSDLTKGTTSGVCSAMIFGNFNDLMIGMFGGLDVLIDPFSGSANGTIRVAMYQDIDVAVRHAESFAAIQDITTA